MSGEGFTGRADQAARRAFSSVLSVTDGDMAVAVVNDHPGVVLTCDTLNGLEWGGSLTWGFLACGERICALI